MEHTKPVSTNSLLPFFIITFVFSWFFWGIDILASQNVISLPFSYMVFFVIGAFGPLVGAMVMTYQLEGGQAVKALIWSGFNLRMKPVWWLLILGIPFAIAGLALWLNVTLNNIDYDQTLLQQPLMIVPTFIAMFFIGGSIEEEYGWRGYALPRLLKKWNPLAASLILGTIWGVWHLPLFYINGTGQFYMPFGIFFLITLAFSVLFTWFFLGTRYNLFSALLFHTALNTSFSVYPPIVKQVNGNQVGLIYVMLAYGLVAVLVVIFQRTYWLTKINSK